MSTTTNVDAISFQMGFDAASEKVKVNSMSNEELENLLSEVTDRNVDLQQKLLQSQASELMVRKAITEYVIAVSQRALHPDIKMRMDKALSTPPNTAELEAYVESEIERRLGEPVARLGRWKIDKSTGKDILTLDGCSVIEGKYANYIMGLLKKEIDKVVDELESTLR